MIANVMLWYFFCLLELSGDIEFNPGRKPDSSQSFSICHWTAIACQLGTTLKYPF